jgi:hypothetical protein
VPSLVRSRASFIALAVLTMAVGLAVHFHGRFLGVVFQDVVGDALWAAMVAWWVAALVPGASPRTRVAAALAICFAVELSQRYHAPILEALRQTTAGHLVLGSGFHPRDFISYTLGVLAATLLERMLLRRRRWSDPGLTPV